MYHFSSCYNPNDQENIINIFYTDIFGKSVLKQETNNNETKVKVLINDLVNGSYLVRLQSEIKSIAKQLIVVD